MNTISSFLVSLVSLAFHRIIETSVHPAAVAADAEYNKQLDALKASDAYKNATPDAQKELREEISRSAINEQFGYEYGNAVAILQCERNAEADAVANEIIEFINETKGAEYKGSAGFTLNGMFIDFFVKDLRELAAIQAVLDTQTSERKGLQINMQVNPIGSLVVRNGKVAVDVDGDPLPPRESSTAEMDSFIATKAAAPVVFKTNMKDMLALVKGKGVAPTGAAPKVDGAKVTLLSTMKPEQIAALSPEQVQQFATMFV